MKDIKPVFANWFKLEQILANRPGAEKFFVFKFKGKVGEFKKLFNIKK